MTQGAAAVGIILVVRQQAGSLAVGGAVVAALSIAAGVSRPIQGRLIDRRSAVSVMVACGLVHPLALGGIVGLARASAPAWSLVVLGVLAGAGLPPVSTSMRVEWGALVRPDERTAAYSLVYLVQELSILVGPLVLAGAIAASSASLALIAVAVLAGLGTLGFAASLRAARPHLRSQQGSTMFGVLRGNGMPALVGISVLVGGVVGGLEVAAPAIATAHHAPAAAGLLVAALSVGGIGGAVIYGLRRWTAVPARRLLLLLALLFGALAVMAVTADGLLALGALLFLAGLSLNPALTTISLLVDQFIPGSTAAEAFGWLSTGFAGGAGGASAVAGAVAQAHHSPRAALIVAAISGLAATVVAALVARSGVTDRGGDAPA